LTPATWRGTRSAWISTRPGSSWTREIPATIDRIQRDVESGIESGVGGTPTLFIDGRRYEGPRDVESLSLALSGANP
jgi:hypothetical protein